MTWYTTGQIARKLRVAVSTIKRWAVYYNMNKRNRSGWILFSEEDLSILKKKRIYNRLKYKTQAATWKKIPK